MSKKEPQKLILSIDANLNDEGNISLALNVDLDCSDNFAYEVMGSVMSQSPDLKKLFTNSVLSDMIDIYNKQENEN